MAKLLLPTLSSLAFLPTVSIAAKRRFHMEAMVYLFTTFFVAVSPGPGQDPAGPPPGPEGRGRLSPTSLCWVMQSRDGKEKERAQRQGERVGGPPGLPGPQFPQRHWHVSLGWTRPRGCSRLRLPSPARPPDTGPERAPGPRVRVGPVSLAPGFWSWPRTLGPSLSFYFYVCGSRSLALCPPPPSVAPFSSVFL